MSQLDIIEAVRALEARLKLWGCSDAHSRAEGFIDDLVRRGWQMSAQRETRPAALKRDDQCARCGGTKGDCHCTRERLAADHDDDPNPRATHTTDPRALAHAEMARAKARLCGCGVRAEVCPVHRNEPEEAS